MSRPIVPNSAVTRRFLSACLAHGAAVFSVVMLTMALIAAPAQAGKKESSTEIDSFSGRLGHKVQVTVPPFHQLEPNIAISYSSNPSNGFLGVGGGLGATSAIQRGQPGGGAPKNDMSDVMFLDGQRLSCCRAGHQSPSCRNGGTHATRVENYAKIYYNNASAEWYIWAKTGVKSTYIPKFYVDGLPFRWMLASRVDPLGNTVTYNNVCEGSPAKDCYLDSITYNGNTIKFHRESRPDPVPIATGKAVPIISKTCCDTYDKYGNCTASHNCSYNDPSATNGSMDFRLKTIEVRVGSTVARAYTLGYTPSAKSGRSQLTSVQAYGRGSSVDASGNVSGTSLPAMTQSFDTADSKPLFKLPAKWMAGNGPDGEQTRNACFQYTGDFNGDGLTDWMYLDEVDNLRGWKVATATKSGFNAPTQWLAGTFVGTTTCYDTCYETCYDKYGNSYQCNPNKCNPHACDVNVNTHNCDYQFTGDFNGDGRIDWMFYNNNGWYVATANDTGTGFNAPSKWLDGTGPSGATYNLSYMYTGDFNGDGKMDYMYNRSGWYVALSSGGNFTYPVLWLGNYQSPSGRTYNPGYQFPGDYNGDGKTDFMFNYGGWHVALSMGDTFLYPELWLTNRTSGDLLTYNRDYEFVADFNGDGKLDFMWLNTTGSGWYVALGTGAGFQAPTLWLSKTHGPGNTYNLGDQFVSDLNGDGMADWMYFNQGWWVALSTGSSFNMTHRWLEQTMPATTTCYETCYDTCYDKYGNTYQCKPEECNPYTCSLDGQTQNTSYQYLGDFNGDGLMDFMYWPSVGGTPGWHVALNEGHQDLLTCIANGVGGKSTIGYAPSSAWEGNKFPAGMVFPTVESISVEETATQEVATTNYTYENGWFMPTQRQFLGFRRANVVSAETGAYSQTYYWQRPGTFGKPEVIYKRRANGDILSFDMFRFTENPTCETDADCESGVTCVERVCGGAHTSLTTEAWSYECNGDAVVNPETLEYVSGCRIALNTFEYDDYGNIVAEYQWGDYDDPNDDRTAVRSFQPKTTDGKYIVGLPVYEEIRKGVSPLNDGEIVARTVFYYDGASDSATPPEAGLLTKREQYNDESEQYVTYNFGYDNVGNQTSVTDPLGRTATKVFDATYRVYAIQTKSPAPFYHTTYTNYDWVLGSVLSQTDPNGATTSHLYDAMGRATHTTRPDGSQVKIEYLGWGDPTQQRIRTSVLQPGEDTYYQTCYETCYQTCYDMCPGTCYDLYGTPYACDVQCNPHNCNPYNCNPYECNPYQVAVDWAWEDAYTDGLGRQYKTVSMSGLTARTYYGPTGKKEAQTLPYNPATETPDCDAATPVLCDRFMYDEIGRLTKRINADGTQPQIAYDDASVSSTDADDVVHTNWYDLSGRITRAVETIDGVERSTYFYYDLLGRRTRSVDALGNQTEAYYDSLGRVLQKSDPDTGLWTYTYNKLNQIVTETDARGHTTTLSYDALGRATRRTYHDGTYDSFVFDEAGRGASKGRLTTSTSASGVISRAWYDNMSRRTRFEQVVDGVTKAISHTYDLSNRVASVTYPDNEVVTYGYASTGMSQGRLVSVSGSVAGTIVSNMTYTTRGQLQTITYGNNVTTTFNYGAAGERVSNVSVGSLLSLSYGYKPSGLVTSVTSPQLLDWTYQYDSAARLTNAVNTDGGFSQSFRYDPIGRMTKQGTSAYSYGAPSHVHAVTAALGNTYTYDANGNMTLGGGRSYVYGYDHRPKTIVANGLTTNLVYNAQGVRVKKSSGQGTTVYTGSIYEVEAGAVTKYYMAGGMRVAKRNSAGNQYFHTDHLGSTRLITNASGAEVMRYDYSPYGKVLVASGTKPDSHTFTGQEADDETGLMFFQSRYYDPALARFVQPDSLLPNADSPQQLDLYAYANNSPVNYVDPDGHAPVVLAIAAWAGASAATLAAISAAAVWINIAAVVIGTALTFTDNPYLQTIGMVMAAMGGGAWSGLTAGEVAVAGAVALAQSPISPLDPSVKKVIGWAWTLYTGFSNIKSVASGASKPGIMGKDFLGLGSWVAKTGSMTRAAIALAVYEVVGVFGAYHLARWVSGQNTDVRYAFAFIVRAYVFLTQSTPGPLAMVGSTYDMAYTLKYPSGRVIDLTGGQGGETWTFYYHTGYESGMAFGRQHIRAGDPAGGYWELGDDFVGWAGPGLGFGGWGATQKIRVIMTPCQAKAFRRALQYAAEQAGGGGYEIFHNDSYTYISEALEAATGKSAADMHINPGLIHW